MPDIYHIVKREDWEAALPSGAYAPASLEHEGFIHCSKQWQVLDVANTRYHGRKDLVLLRIDTDRVAAEIRNEDCFNTGQRYPHIYGQLDLEAVSDAFDFPHGPDGTFVMPAGLS